ncbi:hypothetical protein [Alkalibacter saccharofermentans]|uniref:hypothetical protein n=1 Tax=Alkalibacter saccharofermentans TaxID=235931 RepID=UPI00241CC30F|nr:hypothetical protein [Alkalibacter saccharofermentans]
MCTDYGSLKDQVAKLVRVDIDAYHVDIVHDSYVPNFGMGFQVSMLIFSQKKKRITL